MTANVGNPMPPITMMNCRGSQFVTKWLYHFSSRQVLPARVTK
jgi:hypothetical protein